MIVNRELTVIKDTYALDEGKTIVSENVIRCMKGESTNYYDKKNRYIEVTSPITESGSEEITGVMLASVIQACVGGQPADFLYKGQGDPVDHRDPDAGFFCIGCLSAGTAFGEDPK